MNFECLEFAPPSECSRRMKATRTISHWSSSMATTGLRLRQNQLTASIAKSTKRQTALDGNGGQGRKRRRVTEHSSNPRLTTGASGVFGFLKLEDKKMEENHVLSLVAPRSREKS